MIVAPEPTDEAERLKVLQSLDLLDTQAEPLFDIFAWAAQKLAGTEIALVSLVDRDRQWFKARVGLDAEETPRDFAFCAHAILGSETFHVSDALCDERFFDNPLVTTAPRLRAYAGAPINVGGHNVGTVCAASSVPQRFSCETLDGLKMIAAAAAEQMTLRRQLAFRTRLLEYMSDAVVTAQSDGTITYLNEAAQALFGYSAEEALGAPLSALVPERLRARHVLGFARMWENENSVVHSGLITTGLHRDGREIPVELTVSSWHDGAEVIGAAVVRDRREQQALVEAKAVNEAQDRFLFTMSHEIRTPLNGILGLAEALERTELKPPQAEMLRHIQSSGATLERLLTDVLEAARMRAGEMRLVEAPVEVSKLVADIAATYRPGAESKGVVFSVHAPEPRHWVRTDAVRLSQILGNLISNAVKFTAMGEVSVTAEPLADALWRFTVSDTGIGFTAEVGARIFQPFRQADDTITRRYGGSGLGLSVSRDLARALGGSLVAEAEAGQGATFVLTLPLTPCEPVTAMGEDVSSSVVEPDRPLRVLLAEDHPTNRRVIELILAQTDVELTMVENGALALEACKAEPFDVVLMDVQMPVMDGLTAIGELRRLEQATGASPRRILTLTANAFAEDEQASLAAGADGHLTKPIKAATLLAALAD